MDRLYVQVSHNVPRKVVLARGNTEGQYNLSTAINYDLTEQCDVYKYI